MRESCIKCGEKFTKFGYLMSDDPLCPECREEVEEEEEKSREGNYPLDFIFGPLW